MPNVLGEPEEACGELLFSKIILGAGSLNTCLRLFEGISSFYRLSIFFLTIIDK
jgi:hypothetical protein